VAADVAIVDIPASAPVLNAKVVSPVDSRNSRRDKPRPAASFLAISYSLSENYFNKTARTIETGITQLRYPPSYQYFFRARRSRSRHAKF
jgi:hypothetical protein